MNLPDSRRIVTGDDANGRSRIVEDAPARAIRTVEARPGDRAVTVWRTAESPAKVREIYAVMDEGETLTRAGDVLIQRAPTTPGPTAPRTPLASPSS